jgi:hypothetical protein
MMSPRRESVKGTTPPALAVQGRRNHRPRTSGAIDSPAHCGFDGQRGLVELCSELLRCEGPVALGHEFTDFLPVRVFSEQHPEVIVTDPRGEERVTGGQQRLAFIWGRTQPEQGDRIAGGIRHGHEQAE